MNSLLNVTEISDNDDIYTYTLTALRYQWHIHLKDVILSIPFRTFRDTFTDINVPLSMMYVYIRGWCKDVILIGNGR